jgi:hypothetical protein
MKAGFAANLEPRSGGQLGKSGRPKKVKILNMLHRFQDYNDSILAFMND